MRRCRVVCVRFCWLVCLHFCFAFISTQTPAFVVVAAGWQLLQRCPAWQASPCRDQTCPRRRPAPPLPTQLAPPRSSPPLSAAADGCWCCVECWALLPSPPSTWLSRCCRWQTHRCCPSCCPSSWQHLGEGGCTQSETSRCERACPCDLLPLADLLLSAAVYSLNTV